MLEGDRAVVETAGEAFGIERPDCGSMYGKILGLQGCFVSVFWFVEWSLRR